MLAPCSHQAMECGARKSASAPSSDRTYFPVIMALDLGLTTYQLLSALDGVAPNASPGPVGLNPESTKNQRPGGSPGAGPARFAADRLESHTPGLKPAERLRQSRRHHQQRRSLS